MREEGIPELAGLPRYLLGWIERTRAHDPVVVFDAEGRLRLATRSFEELTGVPCAALIGSLPPFPWWGDPERNLQQLRFLLSDESHRLGVQTLAGHVLRPDGSRVPALGQYEQVRIGEHLVFHLSTYAADPEPSRGPEQLRILETALRRISSALEDVGLGAGAALRRLGQGLDLRSLTAREREVLESLLRGRRAREIAAELGLSPHTARNHVRAIYAKLGVHSQLELLSRSG